MRSPFLKEDYKEFSIDVKKKHVEKIVIAREILGKMG